MANTVRFLPTAIIYLDGTVILTSETIVAVGGLKTTIASTLTLANAAITEINTYYWLYGYSVSPNIPLLPTVAAATQNNALANAIFYQSNNGGTGFSVELVDRTFTEGYARPQSALDAILSEPNLSNIKQALANIASGKS